MKLRALFAPLALAAAIALTAEPAHAQVVDPCTVYTCMAGISGTGLSGGPGCTPATAVFLAISVYDPSFDPGATSLARRSYLTVGCPMASFATNAAILEAIMATWGEVP